MNSFVKMLLVIVVGRKKRRIAEVWGEASPWLTTTVEAAKFGR